MEIRGRTYEVWAAGVLMEVCRRRYINLCLVLRVKPLTIAEEKE